MIEFYLIPFRYNNDPILFKEKMAQRIFYNHWNKKYNPLSTKKDFYIIPLMFNSNSIEEDIQYLKDHGIKILEYK